MKWGFFLVSFFWCFHAKGKPLFPLNKTWRQEQKIPSSIEATLQASKKLLEKKNRLAALELLKNALLPFQEGSFFSPQLPLELLETAQCAARLFFEDTTFQVYQKSANFLKTHELRSAQKGFLQALDKEPDNLQILAGLGFVQLLNNQTEEAKQTFLKALSLFPYDPEIQVCLAHLNTKTDLASSCRTFEAQKKNLFASERAMLWYAKALIQSHDPQKAITLLMEHTQQYPLHLEAKLLLYTLKPNRIFLQKLAHDLTENPWSTPLDQDIDLFFRTPSSSLKPQIETLLQSLKKSS